MIGTPNIDPHMVGSPYKKDPNKVPVISETPHIGSPLRTRNLVFRVYRV